MTGGSLRHDANVLTVTGMEAELHRGDKLQNTVDQLTNASVLGIIYTSPSHTEDRQRWRVLFPFSTPAAPGVRAKMLGRLNGLYQGIFASESWTLSQSYYFGSVRSNPSHCVQVIDGTPIDEHDDLDVTWAGKPNTDRQKSGQPGISGKANEDELLEQIVKGESYHAASLRLLGIWARAGTLSWTRGGVS